jgi:mono/diheme cytochrome c family protein
MQKVGGCDLLLHLSGLLAALGAEECAVGKLITGIVIGVLGVAAGSYVYLHYGFINMQADRPIMGLERVYMGDAMDSYAGRFAPRVANPVQASDAVLIEGIRLYKSNCAVCHGGPDVPVSGVGAGLYPPAPQFLKDSPDMPQNQNYWIIKHGIARTGMPAWDKVLSDNDIWKLTAFLSKMEELDRLSPAVQEAWKTGGQIEVGAQQKPGASPVRIPAMPRPSGHAHSH